MSKSPFPLAVAAFAIVLALATQPSAAAETTVAEQYRILLDQYETEGGTRLFAKRFLALATEHPDDPASVDALIWVVSKVRGNSDTEQAIGLLLKHHVRSSKLAPACEAIAASRCGMAESLLRAILEKNSDNEVQAQACYGLALLLDGEANVVAQLKSQPELAPRILQYYGVDYGKHLLSLDPAALLQQREEIYARMLQSFPNIRANGTTLGKIAETALFAIRHLSVGKSAPEIAGQDIHGKPLKLSDFRGKVVMLSFWGHWWAPCREMYPHERSLVKKFRDKPFVLLGVNSDEDRAALKKTLVDERITWRSWWDEGSISGPIHTTWQVIERPTVHLIDHRGVIRYKNVSAEELDAAIDTLMAELPAEPR